ncbi:hypothetical protein ABH931_006167 [Streptacidiphilus sp. MAP12-33]|uniref:glycoside hydrolase domain-containing protein n=1 Tax=Streptacidiphilus sp. MAP12-33 TaxID=3156266 RepID=UPI003511B69E
MGQQTGIDIAWARPTIAQIKATGATWVARYFSSDVTKNLTATEVTDYVAANLGIVTVWENAATRALQGFQAGVDDAKAARAQRASVGLPDTVPVHFAVDTDTGWGPVAAYFQGVFSVLGFAQTGAYGGLKVIEGAHAYGIPYLWQTVAWSGGLWAPYATIRQPGGMTLNGGADYDTAETPDFGQYPRPTPPKPPAPTLLEDDMLAYLPPIAANTTVDVPVEPAGTQAAPGGGARNGPMWLCLTGQAAGTVSVALHQRGAWQTAASHPVGPDAGKLVITLPTDGSVDVVRLQPTVELLGYVVGRQVS